MEKRFESVKMIFDKHTHRRKPLMAILQLIAEKEKSLCFDFLEEKIRTVKDKDGKVLLDENGNAIVKTVTGTARIIRDSLPNASYIGFTGTPISREDRSTIQVFGDYIDVYDMTQAVLNDTYGNLKVAEKTSRYGE